MRVAYQMNRSLNRHRQKFLQITFVYYGKTNASGTMRFVQQLVTLKSSILQWALHMQLTSFTRSLTHARGFHLEKSLRLKREHTILKPEKKRARVGRTQRARGCIATCACAWAELVAALTDAICAKCGFDWQLDFVHEAGGSPAASSFLLLRQKKGTKEKATRVRRPAKTRGSLRYSKRQAAAELLGRIIFRELCKQCGVLVRQSSRNAPVASALLGDSHGAFLLLSWSLR